MKNLNLIGRRIKLVMQVARYGRLEKAEPPDLAQVRPEELAEIKTFFPMDKFFILGFARSGTTLLTRLIRLHPEVHCNYQAHFFTRPPLLSGMAADPAVREWLARPSNRWNRGGDLSTIALRAMADYILERDARREGARIVGDKSPNVLMNSRAIMQMSLFYPEAKVVVIIRDGRDALVSQRFQNFINSPHRLSAENLRIRDEFAADPAPFLSGTRSIFTEKRIRDMSGDWAANVTETSREGRAVYGDRFYSLKYEDLLNQPYETISKVWEFLGADPAGLDRAIAQEMEYNPDADYQKEVAADLVKPLEKGKHGSWRELFTSRDRQIFKEIAGQALIGCGYEKDLEW
ncbi:MAG: sulfotransferase [Anaerolineales bacterium]|nr:sulfotransferase [Anaerolineales bacterium]